MVQNIFDSHAHYDDESFDGDRDSLIPSLFEKGVCGIINVGCNIPTSKSAVALAKKYDRLYAAVGFHPQDADKAEADFIGSLRSLASEKEVVAIGEIGLDYHFEPFSKETQISVFEAQLELANSIGKPVIIHSRDASADTLEILKRHKPKGVLHCFSGSVETARPLLEMGMYLGFTGVATFKNAKKAKAVIAATPLERLLVETDCPYMAPEPFRGERSQSDMIEYTARAIAEIKSASVEEILLKTAENARRLFNLD